MLSVWHLAGGAAGNRADSCCFGGFLPNNECNESQTACAPGAPQLGCGQKRKVPTTLLRLALQLKQRFKMGLNQRPPD